MGNCFESHAFILTVIYHFGIDVVVEAYQIEDVLHLVEGENIRY